jgi:hypothetical protein
MMMKKSTIKLSTSSLKSKKFKRIKKFCRALKTSHMKSKTKWKNKFNYMSQKCRETRMKRMN